jgi:hypothetical protein
MSKLEDTTKIQDLPSPNPSLSDGEGEPKLEGNGRIYADYSPSEEASQLPPGAGGEGDDAIAHEPSVFDDPELRKFYWPRKDYEGIHRFFPDFKWTVAEEKR